jgi:thioredoxin reductase (NADPH)
VDPGGPAFVEQVAGKQAVPVVTLEDDSVLVRWRALTASRNLVEKLRSHPKIRIRYRTGIDAFLGEDRFEGIRVRSLDSEAIEMLTPAGVFLFIGMAPNTAYLRGSVELDCWGFMRTSPTLETSLKGVYARGNLRPGSTKQVASAARTGRPSE